MNYSADFHDEWINRKIAVIHPFVCPYRRYSRRYKEFVCTSKFTIQFDLPLDQDFDLCMGNSDGFVDCPLERMTAEEYLHD